MLLNTSLYQGLHKLDLVTDSCDVAENCSWTTEDTQFKINVISYRYCYSTISAAGIACSLLLLATLRRACFQSADVYTYLRCLMVSDCLVLTMSGATMLADSWLPSVQCDGRTFLMRSRAEAVWRVVFLPLVNALIVFSMGVQLWMTLDRYLAVCAARRRPARSHTHRRLLVRVAATLLLALAMHAPLVLGYRLVRHCPSGHLFFELALSGGTGAGLGRCWTAYQWSLQLLARWTPTGLLLYCNGYIIAAIRRQERRVSCTLPPPLSAAGAAGPTASCQTGESRAGAGQSEPRLSVVSDVCQQQQQQQQQQPPRRRRRQEAGHRLELLLAAMGVSYLVTNCLQMALFIAQYVYDQRDVNTQIFRAIANNYEALNFVLDSVFAMAFMPQIRREAIRQMTVLFR